MCIQEVMTISFIVIMTIIIVFVTGKGRCVITAGLVIIIIIIIINRFV